MKKRIETQNIQTDAEARDLAGKTDSGESDALTPVADAGLAQASRLKEDDRQQGGPDVFPQLQSALALFTAVFEHAPLAYAILDKPGTVRHVNRQFRRLVSPVDVSEGIHFSPALRTVL